MILSVDTSKSTRRAFLAAATLPVSTFRSKKRFVLLYFFFNSRSQQQQEKSAFYDALLEERRSEVEKKQELSRLEKLSDKASKVSAHVDFDELFSI
jgi:hypothetical protein